MNAAVLPDPVAAQAQMSLPASATGMVADWTGVGSAKPMAVMPLTTDDKVGEDSQADWIEAP